MYNFRCRVQTHSTCSNSFPSLELNESFMSEKLSLNWSLQTYTTKYCSQFSVEFALPELLLVQGTVGNVTGRASRYAFGSWVRNLLSTTSTTTMAKAEEFTIKVHSDDPEKKEKPLSDKPDFEGLSKITKDEESEELVRTFSEWHQESQLTSACSQRRISSSRSSSRCSSSA
jgi:hypothetical protein